MSSDFSCKATQTGFARRVLTGVLLCAISVCSVPPWLRKRLKKQPQRHRGHRNCTEKSDFSCKATQTQTVSFDAVSFGKVPNTPRQALRQGRRGSGSQLQQKMKAPLLRGLLHAAISAKLI